MRESKVKGSIIKRDLQSNLPITACYKAAGK